MNIFSMKKGDPQTGCAYGGLFFYGQKTTVYGQNGIGAVGVVFYNCSRKLIQ